MWGDENSSKVRLSDESNFNLFESDWIHFVQCQTEERLNAVPYVFAIIIVFYLLNCTNTVQKLQPTQNSKLYMSNLFLSR